MPQKISSRREIKESQLQDSNQHLTQENRRLQRHIEQLSGALARANRPRKLIPLAPAVRKFGKEFVRVIIPDSHGSAIDPIAAGIFLADLKTLAPREIVMLGDHVDCGGFLAQHHTLGYVAQTDYCYEDDLAAANHFLDAIQKAAPAAPVHYIEGNHERRVETWCVTQTLRHAKDCEMLRRAVAPEFLLHLKERGIRYYRQSEYYNGLIVPGAIKLGHCYFWHGVSAAKQAASVNIAQFAGNVVYGHTHRAQSETRRPVARGDIGAWNPGCLCRQQPLWQHTRPTDWTLGYGVQIVDSRGGFLHINVGLVDGRSLLMPLLNNR
jgi:UDP-2,3-diacylglucosamine pyrophosphatase LpxH